MISDLAYIDKTVAEKQRYHISQIITNYGGSICKKIEEANIIVVNNIYSECYCTYANVKLVLSYRCLIEMENEAINPFKYKAKSRYLQNIYLHNKTFDFVDVPENQIKNLTFIINSMDGIITNENPEYYLSIDTPSNENLNCVSINWIYTLQHSSLYVNPKDYLIINQLFPKKANKSNINYAKNAPIMPLIKKKFVLPIFTNVEEQPTLEFHKQDTHIQQKSTQTLMTSNAEKPIIDNDNKFHYDNSFIFLAFIEKKKNKYSYERLKHVMTRFYPKLKDVDIAEFKDSCKFCFSLLKSINNDINHCLDYFTQYKEITKQLTHYLNCSPAEKMNIVQPGFVQRKGPWSDTEIKNFKFILMEKSHQKTIYKKGKIDWITTARYIPGRTPRSCYDLYLRLKKSNEIEPLENIISLKDPEKRYNKIIYKSFTPTQEIEILNSILDKIDNGELVTIVDVSNIAKKFFYSPFNLAQKAVIFSCLEQKLWPFNKSGDLDIDKYTNELELNLELALLNPI